MLGLGILITGGCTAAAARFIFNVLLKSALKSLVFEPDSLGGDESVGDRLDCAGEFVPLRAPTGFNLGIDVIPVINMRSKRLFLGQNCNKNNYLRKDRSILVHPIGFVWVAVAVQSMPTSGTNNSIYK